MDTTPLSSENDGTPNGSSGLVDRPLKNRDIDYSSFPGEIRNQIMSHVLVPGEIHIRPPPISTLNAQDSSTQPSTLKLKPALAEPGYQFLGTTRQAYMEGHESFYSGNIFYLPPGPLPHTIAYFTKLQPNHIALIKTICIKFSLEDVVLAHLKEIDSWVAKMRYDTSILAKSLWRKHVMRAVEGVWNDKLRWIRDWTSLERVILESPLGTLELKGAEIQQTLQGPLGGYVGHPADGYEHCSPEVAAFMRATSREVSWNLESQSFSYWETAKRWLLARSCQPT